MVTAKTKSTYKDFFPSSIALETTRVILRLLKKEDVEPLSRIANNKIIWKYFTRELDSPDELSKWIDEALEERAAEKRMPFVIIDKYDGQVCGSTSFGNISFFDKRVEIGWSWLGTSFMGSGINKHAKFALLSFAFEVMELERVEIKTDNLNERAKAALRKIGAVEEGILRNHMQMHSNRRRDSVYFSILKSEWPAVKEQFFGDLL